MRSQDPAPSPARASLDNATGTTPVVTSNPVTTPVGRTGPVTNTPAAPAKRAVKRPDKIRQGRPGADPEGRQGCAAQISLPTGPATTPPTESPPRPNRWTEWELLRPLMSQRRWGGPCSRTEWPCVPDRI